MNKSQEIAEKYFICDMCGKIEPYNQNEKEPEDELKKYFGDVDKSECAIVCDSCWEKVKPV